VNFLEAFCSSSWVCGRNRRGLNLRGSVKRSGSRNAACWGMATRFPGGMYAPEGSLVGFRTLRCTATVGVVSYFGFQWSKATVEMKKPDSGPNNLLQRRICCPCCIWSRARFPFGIFLQASRGFSRAVSSRNPSSKCISLKGSLGFVPVPAAISSLRGARYSGYRQRL